MTRVTFSADRHALNFELPKGWSELSEAELVLALKSKSRLDEPHLLKWSVLLRLTGLKAVRREGKNWVCRIKTGEKKPMQFLLDTDIVPGLIEGLDWLDEPGDIPVRCETLHGAVALPAKLHGTPFTTYLQCENCYQGILMNHREEAVQQLATLLYPGLKGKLAVWEQLMAIQWWAQVKGMFAGLFPHFFKPAGGDGGGEFNMMDVMNNQIRALTGGDVTKEEEILSIDTWRALTELDAKTKEADEFNMKMKKK